MRYMASVMFDAADDADAGTIISGWTLSEGMTVSLQSMPETTSGMIDADGNFREAGVDDPPPEAAE